MMKEVTVFIIKIKKSNGGQSAMMGAMSMESTSLIESAEPKPAFSTATDLAEFILGVNEIIDFMDAAMEDNPGDSERLLEIKADLEAILEDLRDTILVK